MPTVSAPALHRVKFNSVNERDLIDRPGVRRALTQRLPVQLARPSHVRCCDRSEWNKLDGVHLNLAKANPVAAARFDPWPLP